MSIDRFGINRGNIGPLAKCSFEETTDQLFKASIFGEVDNLTGVSSNIMLGQLIKSGNFMDPENRTNLQVPEGLKPVDTSSDS